MIRLIPLAGALLLSTPAYAQPPNHDLSPMRIVIETIDHSKQRYPTVGDWRVKPDGLYITVSKMSDQRHEFLLAAHEMIEAYLALQPTPRSSPLMTANSKTMATASPTSSASVSRSDLTVR